MRNTPICFCNGLQAIPYLAAFGDKIVVWIDGEKWNELLLKHQISHVLLSCGGVVLSALRFDLRRKGLKSNASVLNDKCVAGELVRIVRCFR